jgi:hypothetical protein
MRSFAILISPYRQLLGSAPRLGYDRFLPNPFQFIIHQLSYYSTLYILKYWQHRKINHKNETVRLIINNSYHKMALIDQLKEMGTAYSTNGEEEECM